MFDIETEENLQCGVTSNPGAKAKKGGSGGGNSNAAQGSKRASGNAVGAVLNAIATALGVAKASGAPSRSAGQPSLGAQRQVGNRAGNTAPKAAEATRTPKSVAQQNRDRIARGKAKAEKAKK